MNLIGINQRKIEPTQFEAKVQTFLFLNFERPSLTSIQVFKTISGT